ncbi:FCD domain-containing protein [Streptomyces sp. NPDC050287]|uniref:FCD domain-containing protein n=1 Tax=Streptomyces sp. NPDC050287 TaxID=3365608 RepID=UPI00378E2F3F
MADPPQSPRQSRPHDRHRQGRPHPGEASLKRLTLPPLEIFESRTLLDDVFNNLALQRAEDEDLRHMEAALRAMQGSAHDPRRCLETNVDFHRVIARAARVPLLSGMYGALVLVLTGALIRAFYVDGAEETVRHNLEVQARLLEAIRLKHRKGLETAARLHHTDMISLTHPQRSPSAPVQAGLEDDRHAR